MYVEVVIDEDCDGSGDYWYYTSTYTDSYNPSLSSGNKMYFDIDDDATSLCFTVNLYDEDTDSDEQLDYVSGTGSSLDFTLSSMSSSSSTVNISYDNTGSSESYRAGFEMDVSIY